jgi:hypothetical protein
VTLATDLKSLRRNVHSQHGEDGIIEWVFSKIAPRHRFCVEFGAWDGRNSSNTFNLIANHGWKAIHIEADPRKFQDLRQTAKAYPGITPVCSRVGTAGETALDQILEQHGVPEDFDLLSIDIDGNDHDVWEAMVRFRPALVIIEHNETFPPEIAYVDRGGRGYTGSSAAAQTALAARKGYALLGCTALNCFFLPEALFPVLGVKPQTVEEAVDRGSACYVFINQAGEFVFSDPAVARQLRSVTYSQPLKSLVRRALGLPTFYTLGDAYQEGGAALRFLRRISALLRNSRNLFMSRSVG